MSLALMAKSFFIMSADSIQETHGSSRCLNFLGFNEARVDASPRTSWRAEEEEEEEEEDPASLTDKVSRQRGSKRTMGRQRRDQLKNRRGGEVRRLLVRLRSRRVREEEAKEEGGGASRVEEGKKDEEDRSRRRRKRRRGCLLVDLEERWGCSTRRRSLQR